MTRGCVGGFSEEWLASAAPMAPPQQSEPEQAGAEQGYRRRLRYCGNAEIVEHDKIVAAKGEPAGERRAVQFHGIGLRRVVEDEVHVVPGIARERADDGRVVAGDRIDRCPAAVR